jgi:hypothetical protein
MVNRFRDPTMRQQYDAAVRAYRMKHRDLFDANGNRRTPGSSFASFFWRGYDGECAARWDRTGRATLSYAYWRAGQDCKQEAASSKNARN